jgi:hypothetical protein
MTTTKYIGGPLGGAEATRIGAVWEPFRTARGEWMPTEMRRRMPSRYYEYLLADGVYVYRDGAA